MLEPRNYRNDPFLEMGWTCPSFEIKQAQEEAIFHVWVWVYGSLHISDIWLMRMGTYHISFFNWSFKAS